MVSITALRRIGRAPVVVAVLALALYVPAFWWGAPHATADDRTDAWGIDDLSPLGPLAQAHDIIAPKSEMSPNLGYPLMHTFMVLGAFAPYVGYLSLSGGLDSPTVAYPHGFTDPVAALRNLGLIAHFLSVLLAVGIVVCAYGTARELWDEFTATIAALGAMLVYPMFYYARTSNVDVPVLFFIAAGFWAFAVIAKRGLTLRRAVILGALAGCAVATKEQGFASFAFVPVVLPFMREAATGERLWRSRVFWRAAPAGAVSAIVLYALGSGMVVDVDRWIAHIRFNTERMELARSGGVIFARYYPMSWQGHVELAGTVVALLRDALSAPGLALGVAGVVLAIRRTPRSALLAYSALVYLLILFFSARIIQLRYVMPVALILALYGGFAIVTAWRTARRVMRWATAALAGAAAATLIVWAADLTYAMLNDSRHDAGAWLAARVRPGDALEYFGPANKNPPMPVLLSSRQAIPTRSSIYAADTGQVAIDAIRQSWQQRQPRFVALIPDYTSHGSAPYSASCPPAIYRALEDGSLGYSRVALFQTPALLAWSRRPQLDHPVVNPPIRLYERVSSGPA
ncbi:MAG: ArnT family glycosyltransferase [Gemmatimonadaceae bacterium]